MLHVLPRAGGVLDQPAHEVLCLEKILEAYSRYEDVQMKKSETRKTNREREYDPVVSE